MSSIPQSVSDYVERNAEKFIKRLAKAVSIPSISCDAAYRKHVYEMADWLEGEMKALGIETKQVPLGKQVLEGQEIELPNAILGTLGNDKNKKTVLLYGHFDVQPVSCSIRSLLTFTHMVVYHSGIEERRMGYRSVHFG
jgi:Cys-Gly metallodipeptidase DUG1